jgi:23S rRNA pseudouridine1911/1915/1917 synthase
VTLLDWLSKKFPNASKQTLRRIVQNGRVSIDGVRAKSLKIEFNAGQRVKVSDEAPARKRTPPQKLPFKIVHEDDDVLVIDKPAGLLTSTVAHEKRPTALGAVTEYLSRTQPSARIGLIHRLDRDASGLLVFSKNAGAYYSLKEQFFRHTVDRIYHAIVEGVPTPAEGRIKSKLREANDGSVHSAESGQLATTEYRVIKQSRDGSNSLLRVKLETGRKHQIRAHLAERGWPIVNDPMYGTPRRSGRLMLAATQLAFEHPRTMKRTKLELPLPNEMSAMMRER